MCFIWCEILCKRKQCFSTECFYHLVLRACWIHPCRWYEKKFYISIQYLYLTLKPLSRYLVQEGAVIFSKHFWGAFDQGTKSPKYSERLQRAASAGRLSLHECACVCCMFVYIACTLCVTKQCKSSYFPSVGQNKEFLFFYFSSTTENVWLLAFSENALCYIRCSLF